MDINNVKGLHLGFRAIRKITILLFVVCLLPSLLLGGERIEDDLFSVSFPTEMNGWACGRWGTVIHSSDGGKTWSHQQSNTEMTLSAIFFVDAHKGWAVGDEGTIIHTRDGGKRWEKQLSPVAFRLMDVHFQTDLKGWIVTEQTHILFTGNGGKTWDIQFRGKDFILKAVSFCDVNHGWAVGEYGYIFHTRDGGLSWERQAGYFQFSEDGLIEGGSFLFDVIALDPVTAWAVGIDGLVTTTTDGGKTWRKIAVSVPKTHLFFVSSDKYKNLYIGGDGAFIFSNDGGLTWQHPNFEPPLTYTWLYDISFPRPDACVCVGKGGNIYIGCGPATYCRLTHY